MTCGYLLQNSMSEQVPKDKGKKKVKGEGVGKVNLIDPNSPRELGRPTFAPPLGKGLRVPNRSAGICTTTHCRIPDPSFDATWGAANVL